MMLNPASRTEKMRHLSPEQRFAGSDLIRVIAFALKMIGYMLISSLQRTLGMKEPLTNSTQLEED